jgi:hypothetical protein
VGELRNTLCVRNTSEVMRLLLKANNMTQIFSNNLLLTDAETITPIPTDSEWGVDTVTLYFPFDENLLDLTSPIWRRSSSGIYLDSGKEFAHHVGYLETEHGSVRISLNLVKQICSLHFNAARIVQGKSRQLLKPNALEPLVEDLLELIADAVGGTFEVDAKTGELVRSATWARQVSISRLDLARNLKVSQLPRLKEALRLAIPKNGKTQHVYDSYKGSGWTLVNGTISAGKDRIYDKDAELQGLEVEETLSDEQSWFRFETQLENNRLSKFGLTTLDRVGDIRCWEALQERWTACNWAVTVSEPGTLAKALSHLSAKEVQNLAGFLWQCENGLDDSHTKARQSEYRKKALALGLNPGMPISEQGVGKLHLDLFSGELTPDPTQG